jgi:TolA-binding protein/HEAT repeat protein
MSQVIRSLMLGAMVCAGSLSAQSSGTPPRTPRPVRAPVAAPTPATAPTPAPAPGVISGMFDVDRDLLRATERAQRDLEMSARTLEREAMRATDMARLEGARALMSIDQAALRDAVEHSVAQASVNFDGQLMAGAMAPLAAMGVSRMSGYRTEPPAAWDQQDPADSLYREGRKALAGDAYQKAADLFKQIRQRYPKSSYAPDAPYWEAFALQRLGGETNLRLAQDALGLQQRDYPKAATRGDAASLNARIEGMLARRGDRAMATTLMGRADRAATDGCPRAQDDERIDALNAVTQLDAEKAMPILKKVLARREPCTQQLRRTAVWLVASRKQTESASILMDVAKTDPDREVREQAVFWMANVPTDEATGMLIDLAKNGDDMDLRKRAVYALSRSKTPKAATTLRELALDTKVPEELRGEAFNWYMNSSAARADDDLMPFFMDVYGRADGLALKQRLMSAIISSKIDDTRRIKFFSDLALNDRESMELRRSAVSMIVSNARVNRNGMTFTFNGQNAAVAGTPVAKGQSSASGGTATATPASTAAVAALSNIYDKASDIEIRRQALSSLGSLNVDASIEKLISVARTEKNTELRKSAISYLTRTKDPRAIALLQEIIER